MAASIASIKQIVQIQNWENAYDYCKNNQNRLASLYIVTKRLKYKQKMKFLNKMHPYLGQHPQVKADSLRPRIYYFVKSLGWQRSLQFGLTDRNILEQVLIFMKKKYPKQYDFVYQKYIQKKIPTVNVESKLEKDDYFGPVNKNNINLNDFGFTVKDYILLTKDNIEDFFNTCLKNQIVAVDSQWNPLQQSSLSIIQFASISSLYLFDFLYSSQYLKLEFGKILRRIMIETKIKIIGLSIKGDITKIISHFKLFDISEQKLNLIELGINFTLPETVRNRMKGLGLKSLCKKVFQKQLDKTQTISNWNIRPLRLSQLHYCLLDAYICIQLYERIKQKTQEEREKIYGKQLTEQQLQKQNQLKRLKRQEKKAKRYKKYEQKKNGQNSLTNKNPLDQTVVIPQPIQDKININYQITKQMKIQNKKQNKIQNKKQNKMSNKLSIGELLTQFFFLNISTSEMKNIFNDLYTQIRYLSEIHNQKPFKIFERQFIRVLKKANNDVQVSKIIQISDIYKSNKIDLVIYEITYYQIQRFRYSKLTNSQRIRLCKNMQYIEVEALDYYVKAFRLDQIELRSIIDFIKNNVNTHLWKGNIQNAFLVYELFGKPRQIKKYLEQTLNSYRRRL